MRIFVAVFPPPEVQRAAMAIEDSLKRAGDVVSWVKRENLHYTLSFLGELGEDGARRVGEAAREAASDHHAFEAALGAPGAFPEPRRARALWLSMAQGAESLIALARSLEAALVRRGFDRADKPFSAHLTIGRVRAVNQDWSARLAAAAPARPEARFMVDRLSVIESQLSTKGSIYTIREEARLAS